jgi:hypothetical protein
MVGSANFAVLKTGHTITTQLLNCSIHGGFYKQWRDAKEVTGSQWQDWHQSSASTRKQPTACVPNVVKLL